jgi:hypothetical protein
VANGPVIQLVLFRSDHHERHFFDMLGHEMKQFQRGRLLRALTADLETKPNRVDPLCEVGLGRHLQERLDHLHLPIGAGLEAARVVHDQIRTLGEGNWHSDVVLSRCPVRDRRGLNSKDSVDECRLAHTSVAAHQDSQCR